MTLRAICATLLLVLGAAPAPAQEAPVERVDRLLESLAGYGYGATMGALVLDNVAAWAGEWGELSHARVSHPSDRRR